MCLDFVSWQMDANIQGHIGLHMDPPAPVWARPTVPPATRREKHLDTERGGQRHLNTPPAASKPPMLAKPPDESNNGTNNGLEGWNHKNGCLVGIGAWLLAKSELGGGGGLISGSEISAHSHDDSAMTTCGTWARLQWWAPTPLPGEPRQCLNLGLHTSEKMEKISTLWRVKTKALFRLLFLITVQDQMSMRYSSAPNCPYLCLESKRFKEIHERYDRGGHRGSLPSFCPFLKFLFYRVRALNMRPPLL